MITITVSWLDIILYFVFVFVTAFLKGFVKSAWKEWKNRKH